MRAEFASDLQRDMPACRYLAGCLLLVVVALSLVFVHPGPLQARELRCNDAKIIFSRASDILEPEICRGIASARKYFKRCDFKLPASITFAVDSAVEKKTGHKVFGAYVVGSNAILILDAGSFRRSFETLPISEAVGWREWYQSIIAHEMAHAIIRVNASANLPWLQHEYIAGAVQINSLPGKDREALSRMFPKFTAADGGALLNEFIYAFDPVGFAVGSYVNAGRFPDRCAHLRDVIERKAIPLVAPASR